MIPYDYHENFVLHVMFSAAQMWFLGRILPFLIGEHSPHDDKHWMCYLLLLEWVDILLSPEITVDEVGYLSVLITQHHQQFSYLYGGASLIPKHHYMIHMPRLILKYVCSDI